MFKTLIGFILIIFIVFLYPGVSEALGTMNLNELVEQGKSYDGKNITVQGEALGEAMERGEHAWVNISDPTNVMGIWMNIEDAKKIKFFGDYKHKGDIIKVSGVFHRACSEHGGDMDIHGTAVEIVEQGHLVKEEIETRKIVVMSVLTLITLCIAVFYYKAIRYFKC